MKSKRLVIGLILGGIVVEYAGWFMLDRAFAIGAAGIVIGGVTAISGVVLLLAVPAPRKDDDDC